MLFRSALLEQCTLPFDAVMITLNKPEDWKKILEVLLPGKGYTPTSERRGFDQAVYFKAWTELLNRLDDMQAMQVVEIARRRLGKVAWLPACTRAALWISRDGGRKSTTRRLPEGYKGPTPVIAVNALMSSQRHVSRFRLRDVAAWV